MYDYKVNTDEEIRVPHKEGSLNVSAQDVYQNRKEEPLRDSWNKMPDEWKSHLQVLVISSSPSWIVIMIMIMIPALFSEVQADRSYARAALLLVRFMWILIFFFSLLMLLLGDWSIECNFIDSVHLELQFTPQPLTLYRIIRVQFVRKKKYKGVYTGKIISSHEIFLKIASSWCLIPV